MSLAVDKSPMRRRIQRPRINAHEVCISRVAGSDSRAARRVEEGQGNRRAAALQVPKKAVVGVGVGNGQ